MTYSTINRNKFGNCSQCGAKDTDVVKVKRDLFCLQCHRINKGKEQVKKANERSSIRRLGNKQKVDVGFFEMEVQAMKTELDFMFSRIVRMSAADSVGNCTCFTCGVIKHFSLVDCGHYIKRSNTLLRWNFMNGFVQCKPCNQTKHGNYDVFTKKLIELNPSLVDQLNEQSREVHKYTRDELKQLTIEFRAKLNQLQNKFKK